MIVADDTQLGLLQILGYALVFLGSVPAALALLKPPDTPLRRAPGERPAPAA